LESFESAFPSRVLYMDLETCGFSGSSLFLIGLLRFMEGKPVVEQLLARDYSEESAVLAHFWKLLPAYEVLVTFNGKAFDWPFVRDRSTALRLGHGSSRAGQQLGQRGDPAPATFQLGPVAHLDVLHFARRLWKKEFSLPNCRLQTLESALCRRRRYGDIPGHMIGEAYHAFIRSGDARRLKQVLHHNLVDLLTLAELSLFLIPRAAGEPAPVPSQASDSPLDPTVLG